LKTKRCSFRQMLCLAITVIMALTITIVPAFAAFGESAEKTVTVNGYTYVFYSLIHNEDSNEIDYQTTVKTTSASYVPVGYMGVKARLYSSSGSLIASTDWSYNTDEVALDLQSDYYRTTTGYYYSKGQVKLYYGNGYNTYDSYATPNFAPSRSVTADPDAYNIQRNENGEIYGSEFFLNEIGVQPDLVLAENTAGVVGYVRASDLSVSEVTTPAEAIAAMENNATRSIPMYLSDGETVVGTFVIDN